MYLNCRYVCSTQCSVRMGKEQQLLEAAAAGNLAKVEVR